MSSRYFQYTKAQFELLLTDTIRAVKVPGRWLDITTRWAQDHGPLYERVYVVPTYNSAVDIVIYSSVDIRTNKVREHGADRVRVIYRWRTKNGVIYKHVKWHNRIQTLFQNLADTLEYAMLGARNLPWGGWASTVRELGN